LKKKLTAKAVLKKLAALQDSQFKYKGYKHPKLLILKATDRKAEGTVVNGHTGNTAVNVQVKCASSTYRTRPIEADVTHIAKLANTGTAEAS
jgi:hypothetical protein